MKKIYLLIAILLATGFQVFAQTHLVKGRVLDETGQGYPGAGVSVKGTQIGTVTDVDGNFQLNVPDDNNTLVIQAVGYNRQEVKVTGGTLSIRMTQATHELQGAVVTALAIKREKRELGYTATTVSNEDLTRGNNVSALSALQGKVAGANITSGTNGPGGSTRVVLRGEKSLLHDNNALLVVDGVIISNRGRTADAFDANNSTAALNQIDFGNSGNDINPDDIESVTVLNGPAAAALYGSIGANGAIMITTKSGQNRTNLKKKMEVTYKATYTLSNILKFPDLQNKYGQGNIYDGIPDDRRENFSWGMPFDGQLRPWGQIIGDSQRVKPYSAIPNNIKDFFNNAHTLENYASIAGGSDRSSYFLSISALNNTGVVPNTFYNKYSVRFNGTTKLTNKLYSSINFNYINSYSRVEGGGQSLGSVYDNLLETARDIPITELKDVNNIFNSMTYTDAQGIQRYGYYGAYTRNPYWVAQNYDNRAKTDRVLGDFSIGYKSGNIDVVDRLGVDVSSDRAFYEQPKYNAIAFDPLYDGIPQTNAGGYEAATTNGLLLNNDLIATYNKPLSDNFSMQLLGGHNMRLSNTTSLVGNIDPGTNGLIIPGFYNFDNAQGPVLTSNSFIQTRTIGLYGDATFKYRNSLFFGVTARNDWTSTLIEGNRSYFYPSVNASWVFTEGMHGKIKDNIINYGKLRASYASVGNGASAYQNNNPGYAKTNIAGGFGSQVIFPFNSQPGFDIQSYIGDSTLRPERTNSWEVGTDLSMFKDRFSLSFTYYNMFTVDQIANVPAPPSTGYISRVINLGDVQNKGVEISARVTPVSTHSGLKWDIYGTYTQNISRVVSLENGLSQITLGGLQGMGIVAAVGRPYGSFYAVDLQRDAAGHVIVNSTPGAKGEGTPLATTTPIYEGTFQPKFIASMGTNLSYKGFSLNLLFTTKQGGLFYSRTKSITDFNGTAQETVDRDPKIFPNSVYLDPSSGKYVTNTSIKYSPYYYYSNTLQTIYGQDLVDASFIKLQEASISYNIPDKWIHNTPFGSLSVSIFGNNLFIWTAKSNKYDDPEAATSSGVTGGAGNAQGFNFTSRPSLRNYGASLKVTF